MPILAETERKRPGCLFRGRDARAPLTNGPAATDAVIGEPRQFFGAIHVAQIHQHGLLHHPLEVLEVEGTKLLPFGDDDEGIGVLAQA